MSFIDSVELLDGHRPGERGARFLVTAEHAVIDDVVMDYKTVDVTVERLVKLAVKHPKLTATDVYELTSAPPPPAQASARSSSVP